MNNAPVSGIWPREPDVLAPVFAVRPATQAAALTCLLATPNETVAVVLDGAGEKYVRGMGPESQGLELRLSPAIDRFGDRVAFRANPGTVMVCNVKNPTPLTRHETGPERLEALAVLHDESVVLASTRGLVHQTTQGKLDLVPMDSGSSARHYARALALSPDEQVVALAPVHAPIQLVGLSGSSKPVALHDVALNLQEHSLMFSADGNFVGASGGFMDSVARGAHLQVWDAKTGVLLYSLIGDDMDECPSLTGIAVSAGGRFAASRNAEDDCWLRVWTLADGCLERQLEMGEPDPLTTLDDSTMCAIDWNFTRGGRYLLVRFSPSYVRFYDTGTLVQVATLVLIGTHGDWLITTPSGEYDGTSEAIDACDWHDGSRTVPLLSLPDKRRAGLLNDLLNDIGL